MQKKAPTRDKAFVKFANIGPYCVPLPTLWLGHDLKSTIRVWKDIPQCPGVMLSAHQILIKREFWQSATRVGLRRKLGFDGPIFLDSGGFVSQKQDRCTIGVDQVLSVYEDLRPDIGAVLDFPINPLTSRRAAGKRWNITLSNTDYMKQRALDCEIVPVLHSHGVRMLHKRHLQLAEIVSNPRFLCVGSLVPLLRGSYIGKRFSSLSRGSPTIRRWRLITQLLLTTRKLYPNSVLHVFGVGSVSTMLLLYLLGVDSVDSVGWRIKAAYGEIQLAGLSNRSLVADKSRSRTRRTLTNLDRLVLSKCRCPICRDLSIPKREAALKRSYHDRAIHNAFVMVSELQAFRSSLRAGRALEHVTEALKANQLYSSILNSVIIPALTSRSLEVMKGGTNEQ